MKIGKREWVALLVLLLVVAGAVYFRWVRPRGSATAIASSGGISMSVNRWPVTPFHLQRDPHWEEEKMGGSDETIGAVGCTLCCISMAFTHLGVPVTPKEFNDYLKAHGGYNEKGMLVWGGAAAFSGGKIAFDIPSKPSFDAIDGAIRSGQFVVVKVLLHGTVAHWVLIVGKEGQEYLVKNPLNGDLTLEKLSSLSDRIQSIRIVKATATGA